MHHFNLSKTHGEKARWELLKDAASCLEKILEAATPKKKAAVWPLTLHFDTTNFFDSLSTSIPTGHCL